MLRRAGWPALVTLAAAAAGLPPAAADAPDPDLPTLERAVADRIDGHRAGRGLPALAYRTEIADAARRHSEAMAAGRVGFGHAGFQEWMKALGSALPYSAAAENVSKHRSGRKDVPDAALELWLASDVHRKNLEGSFTLTGVGAATAEDGSVYLTQIFLAR